MTPSIWMVVVQPTTSCNIDCRYCYLPDRRSAKRLELDTLARIGRTIFDSPFAGGRINFLWHAGEPLVLPPAYYERAFDLLAAQNRRQLEIRHLFQTNATLVDERWCAFIRERAVDVGVSIDGPAFLHDASRVDRAGRGTFARTVAGMRLLRSHGIPVHVLGVLTRRALDHADAWWDFIVEEELDRISFNIEEIEGAHDTSSLQCADAFDACGRFFDRLLELRERSGRNVGFRDVDSMIVYLTHGGAAIRLETMPLSIVTFDHAGNLSTFSPELMAMHDADFIFGSAGERLDSVLAHPRFLAVQSEIDQGIARCRTSCPEFDLCGGGSPSNKLGEHGSFAATETMECRLKIKAIAGSVRRHLHQGFDPYSGRQIRTRSSGSICTATGGPDVGSTNVCSRS